MAGSLLDLCAMYQTAHPRAVGAAPRPRSGAGLLTRCSLATNAAYHRQRSLITNPRPVVAPHLVSVRHAPMTQTIQDGRATSHVCLPAGPLSDCRPSPPPLLASSCPCGHSWLFAASESSPPLPGHRSSRPRTMRLPSGAVCWQLCRASAAPPPPYTRTLSTT